MRLAGSVLLGGLLLTGAVSTTAGGQVGAASIQERLKRVAADLSSGTDRLDESIKELKAILALDPSSAEAHMLLGFAYRPLGSPEMMGEAVAELRQALALKPGLAQARLYLAHVYLDLDRTDRARQELDAALTQVPGHPPFLALMAETERRLKNPRRSIEILRQVLAANASFDQARYYLGLALFDDGQREEAIHELERVVASGAQVAEVHLGLGTAYIEVGRLDEAVKVLSQGAQIAPARPDLRIQLARAYRKKKLLVKAEEQLKLAAPTPSATVASQQLEFNFYTEQGHLRLEQKRLDAAAVAFRKVFDMDPADGPTNRSLAEVYLLQGAFAKAADHAARAVKAGFPLTADKEKLLQQKLHAKDSVPRK
jgi:tetratricopeptide (TPR) repeat protein